MNKYTVKVNNEKRYDVVETLSGLIIKEYSDVEDAYEAASYLENGGGFAGLTPPFFVTNTYPSANAEIKEIFSEDVDEDIS